MYDACASLPLRYHFAYACNTLRSGIKCNATVVDYIFKAFMKNVATTKRPFYFHTDEGKLASLFSAVGNAGIKPKPVVLPAMCGLALHCSDCGSLGWGELTASACMHACRDEGVGCCTGAHLVVMVLCLGG